MKNRYPTILLAAMAPSLKHSKWRSLAALLAIISVPVHAETLTIHVAPDGDPKTADGSAARPYPSLQQARDHARRTDPGARDIEILIGEGDYQLQETLELGREDSGTKTHPVVYRGAAGTQARFFGGTLLDPKAFTPASKTFTSRILDPEARNKIVELDLKAAGIKDLGELSPHGWQLEAPNRIAPAMLTIDGQRMRLARWPNPGEDNEFLEPTGRQAGLKGMVSYKSVVDPGLSRPKSRDWHRNLEFMNGGGKIKVAFDRFSRWANPEIAYLDGVLSEPWEWTYNRIAEVDPKEMTIRLARGEVNGLEYSGQGGSHFHFENIPEELDEPGEYFIDRETMKLYLYPAVPLGSQTIVLSSMSDPVLQLGSTSHVRFENLVFDTGRSLFATVEQGREIEFRHCNILNFTLGGISIRGSENTVSHCLIRGVGGFGVDVSGGNLETLEPANNRIVHCEISDFAWDQKSQVSGIEMIGVGNVAANNHIHNAPHFAIKLKGNDHLIEHNEIHNLPLYHRFDGGAIYMISTLNPEQRGTLIRQNHLHDIPTSGVYLDNYTQGFVIEDNIFENVGFMTELRGKGMRFSGVRINGGGQHDISGNVFIDCPSPVSFASWAVLRRFGDRHLESYRAIQRRFGPRAEGTPWEKYDSFKIFLAYKEDDDFRYQKSEVRNNLVCHPSVKPADGAKDGVIDENDRVAIVSDQTITDTDFGISASLRSGKTSNLDQSALQKAHPDLGISSIDKLGPASSVGAH